MARIAENIRKASKTITVDFPNGGNLNLEVRHSVFTVMSAREHDKSTSEARIRASRIKLLEERANTPVNDEEYIKTNAELENLYKLPDMIQIVSEYICRSVIAWDYYETDEDMVNNNPIPITVESLSSRNLDELIFISNALIASSGISQVEGNGSIAILRNG